MAWIPVAGASLAALLVCFAVLWALSANLPGGGGQGGTGTGVGRGSGDGANNVAFGDRGGRGEPGHGSGSGGSGDGSGSSASGEGGGSGRAKDRAEAPNTQSSADAAPLPDDTQKPTPDSKAAEAPEPQEEPARPVDKPIIGFVDVTNKDKPVQPDESEAGRAGKPSGAYGARGAGGRAAGRDFGATKESEAAVDEGLAWLACVQPADGRWSSMGDPGCGEPHEEREVAESRRDAGAPARRGALGRTRGAAGAGRGQLPGSSGSSDRRLDSDRGGPYDLGYTGLATLAFLGAGNTYNQGKYRETVRKALDWIVRREQKDGSLQRTTFYEQGIATMALCEACGMEPKDHRYRENAQQAIDYILSQMGPNGGYGYDGPGDDVHVTSFQIMALKSAMLAKLRVPHESIERLKGYLEKTINPEGTTNYGAMRRHVTPTRTAVGLYCRLFLDYGRKHPDVLKIANLIHEMGPDVNNVFYTYNATYGMFQMQGQHWRDWNEKFRDPVIAMQVKDEGPYKGSWQARHLAGRIGTTAVYIMSLEVYYRYLPVNK